MAGMAREVGGEAGDDTGPSSAVGFDGRIIRGHA